MVKNGVPFDPNFIPHANVAGDIDEVTYMTLYTATGAAVPAKRASQPHTNHVDGPPLIDIVTPQPKAFYAYMRMPKKADAVRKKSQRISRTRRPKGGK